MKIFLISRGLPSVHDPQWGCFEFDQAKALVMHGHIVTILYVDGRFRFFWRKLGVVTNSLEGIGFVGCFLYPSKLLRWLPYKIKERFNSWQLDLAFRCAMKLYGRPDVIYAHYLYNIAWSTHLKAKYGVPLVGIEHWSKLTQKNISPEIKYLGIIAYRNVDKLIAVSDSLKNKINELFGADATVINNMVGGEFFESPTLEKTTGDVVKIVSVGSLIHRKGFDMLIKSFESLGTNYKWELKIIGEGAERIKLQSQITNANLNNRIHLIGKKSKAEIIDIFQHSDMFVLASRAETFGVVYVEAMSQGLPVVATVCGGPEEFVTPKNGLLVPVDNVAALTEALRDMICHVDCYDRRSIAEECRLRFSPELIGKRLSELLGRVKSV